MSPARPNLNLRRSTPANADALIACVLAVAGVQERTARDADLSYREAVLARYGLELAEWQQWFGHRTAGRLGAKRAADLVIARRKSETG